jgi:hypothetical protein
MLRYLGPVLVLFLVSCGTSENRTGKLQIPKDSIIYKDTMVLILADVHLVEAAMMLKKNRGAKPADITGFYFNGIFKKYGISRARYNMNINWYRQDAESFRKMYEQVVALLEQKIKERKKTEPASPGK